MLCALDSSDWYFVVHSQLEVKKENVEISPERYKIFQDISTLCLIFHVFSMTGKLDV